MTLCDSCQWEDREENEKQRELLEKTRNGAGQNAYQRHGCSVCPECEEGFHTHPECCPLRIFYPRGPLELAASCGTAEEGLGRPDLDFVRVIPIPGREGFFERLGFRAAPDHKVMELPRKEGGGDG